MNTDTDTVNVNDEGGENIESSLGEDLDNDSVEGKNKTNKALLETILGKEAEIIISKSTNIKMVVFCPTITKMVIPNNMSKNTTAFKQIY